MELQCDHGPTGPASQDGDWVPAGILLRAHGVHGSIRVRFDISPTQLLKPLTVVRIVPRGGAVGVKPAHSLMHVTHVRDIHDASLVTFKEVPSREAAQLWHGATLQVPADLIPPMDDEAAYMYELAGATVCDTEGANVGVVERVDDNGGQALLVIATAQAADDLTHTATDEAKTNGATEQAGDTIKQTTRTAADERLLPLVGETFVSFCRETNVLTVRVPLGLWE